MEIRDVFVQSLGTYLPDKVSIASAVEQGLYDPSYVELCGYQTTSVAGDTTPAEMTIAAARTALDRAGLESTKVESMIHASVFQPGPAGWSLPGHVLLQLGGGTASVTELRQGCSGMLGGLEIAVGQMTGAQGLGSVLLTAADNFGPILDRWEFHSFVLGDAASAAVLTTTGGFARVRSVNSSALPELEAMMRGDEPLQAPSTSEGRPIRMGARLDDFIDRVMPPMEATGLMAKSYVELATRSAAEAGVKIADLKKVLFNHLARFVLKDVILDPLEIPLERTTWEYGSTVGHLGASDYVTSLDHLLRTGELQPGDHILLLGGSAGYSVSSVVIEILDIPAWARS